MTEFNYQKIAGLDPLGIDEDIFDLPQLNRTCNSTQLVNLGAKMARSFYDIGLGTAEEGYAALRDLDFVASSLDRAGVNPFSYVPRLEEAMLDAGDMAESVPRSTITTYAGANPDGVRRRSFTGSQEEDVFIASLRTSFDELEVALVGLGRLKKEEQAHAYAGTLDISANAVQTLVASMVKVKRTISPEFFTHNIRPFFDPLTIGGRVYAAAGGGQLQLVGIERIAFGVNGVDLINYKFFEENLPYLNVLQRNKIQEFLRNHNDMSILDQVQEGQFDQGDNDDVAIALLSLARMIKKFRYPHRKVALDNFALRSPGSVGSGSYTPTILAELIDETENQILQIGALVNGN